MKAAAAKLPTGAAVLSLWQRHPNIVIGSAMVGFALFVAIAAPWLASADPQTIAPFNRLQAPGAEFWFGGDLVGRDVYSRTIYGARVSLAVGLGVAIGGMAFADLPEWCRNDALIVPQEQSA